MIILFFFSLFWMGSGILGALFGIQKVPLKFVNTEYEKPYRRFMSFIYLLMGVPCFVIWLLAENMIIPSEKLPVIAAVCVIPPILLAIIGHLCFLKRLGK